MVQCYIEWKWVTTSENEWQQVVQQMTASDNKWYNEWQQMTTTDREWQEMKASDKNGSGWQ